ncbi:MAG: type II/IV secretion system protein [Deltaproteobacteria bacterium]|nr:type II/IV secretion system protein [Deltaproteobacteria bacterium]MBW2416759.1 type II/IV secretion system protein [Deltaproteobacteria bacterium]
MPPQTLNTSDPRPPLSLPELLEMLQGDGVITAQQAQDIQSRETTLRSRVLKERVGSVRSQAASRYEVAPSEIVVAASLPHPNRQHRRLDEDTVAEVLAAKSGTPYRKLDPLRLDSELITKTLSRPFVRRHAVIPVGQDGEGLELALTDPFDSLLRAQIEDLIRQPIRYVVSSKRDILAIIDRVYGFRTSIARADRELGSGNRSNAIVDLVELRSASDLAKGDDEAVVSAVDYLLNYAFEQRASDVHIEPRADDGVVRFRIDGILHDIEVVPVAVHGAISSRIKVLARMDIAERRRPQDGRIKTQRGEREVELRVSSMPTAYGEKIVVRVFDPSVLAADLQDLGFSIAERESYERWITAPSGLVLVTGPTGSGKTTTLYSTLRYLSGPEINITTVEDPIEMVDPRFCQVQVNRTIEVSFSSALRSILRQDPDIIMVGEIRDPETAQMAVQSALTGHLVFSTVHTRDAAGAITRLTDLGVERFLLSSVLRGVVAQRLIRKICPHCSVDGFLSAAQVQSLGLQVPVERRERLAVRWGEGCVDCRHTGLYGRSGIFEMLDVGRRVRELVRSGGDASEILRAARIEGLETLRECALRKLASGVTTFEEVARATVDVD